MRAPRATLLAVAAVAALALPAAARGAEEACQLEPKTRCFGLESASASLSTTQAGAHPDLTFSFEVKKDPESEPQPSSGLKRPFAATRHIRIELPPGLIGDPNVLGAPQQCTAAELFTWEEPGGGCPNGAQIGTTRISVDRGTFVEPVYMMLPPGGEAVARVGTVAAIYPIFIDFTVRSEDDYGLSAEIANASPIALLTAAQTTTWGVPSDPVHDTERCTPLEIWAKGCVASPKRPPGTRPLPFLTNPTRCHAELELRVSAASWVEPDRFDQVTAPFPEIDGCNQLPYGPTLALRATSRRAAAPTGLEATLTAPASDGVGVLEPSQTRYIRVDLPEGFAINPSAGEGLQTCSAEQVGFEEPGASHCPDAAKLAGAELEIPVLERNLRGAVYLREPEPGDPFRVWVVADDLGLHVKLPGELELDQQTGQISSVVLGAAKLGGLPQAPVREAKLLFKAGSRAALVNPPTCGEYRASFEFTPWSGGPPAKGTTPLSVDEGCVPAGFSPKLSAGSTDATGGAFSPFLFTLTREDGEQNLQGLEISLPRGLAASFAGIPRCEGAEAETGQCPYASRLGKVAAAVGAGSAPLWVPQPGKRPTAVYLSGPYKGAPTSIVAVVPRQAGPFDFGDEVVRSAIYVDPVTAEATAKADPLPQIIEGIPITYRVVNVQIDRHNFALNPTSCASKQTAATVLSSAGALARPSSPYRAVDCAGLGFKPRLSFLLHGGTHRGSHPSLRVVFHPRAGDANIGAFSVALPHSEFLDQAHIKTVCTRVQFAAHECPAGSIYGTAVARSPLFDFPLEGPLYLRSSDHPLPDMVAALHGPASFPVEVNTVGRVDSVNGGIRTTFESVPDAPISEVVASFPGGKKGLIVNSTNLCAKANRVTAKFFAQNGRRATLHPVLQSSCKKAKRKPRR